MLAAGLLKAVGTAVMKHGLNLLAGGLPVGEVMVEVAREAWGRWRQDGPEDERRKELGELAAAPPDEVRREVDRVVDEVAAGQPAEVRQALSLYLTQVPAAVHWSLRRPADPAGATVPAGLSLDRPEDLLPFLPPRLPRFRPGDPVPGMGDWVLEELLGTGGFGEVWKARNPYLSEPSAVKFCLDADTARLLRNEAELLQRVMREGKHPGIVGLLDTCLNADPPSLRYEYVAGGDLAGLVQERRGGLCAGEALDLMRAITEAVAFAHQRGIVHRDLKPANVLLAACGVASFAKPQAALAPKVADFGIGAVAARPGALATQARTATLARGAYTPLYASPEQVAGQPADPRDDVYALGVIWYQLLTGDLTAAAPSGVRWMSVLRARGVPQEHLDWLLSCVEARQQDRPASASELAAQLRALSSASDGAEPGLLALPLDRVGKRASAPTERRTAPLPPAGDGAPARRSAAGWLLGAGLLAVGLALVAMLTWTESRQVAEMATADHVHPDATDQTSQRAAQIPAGASAEGDSPPSMPPPRDVLLEPFGQRVQLRSQSIEVQQVFFTDAEPRMAVVYSNLAGRPHRVERYSLKNGELLDRVELKGLTITPDAMALSPDGGLLALQDHNRRLRVVSLPDDKEVVTGWEPYGPDPKGEWVAWMSFVDNDRLLAVSTRGQLGVWVLPGRGAVYEKVAVREQPGSFGRGYPDPWGTALSRDRRTLAVFDRDHFNLFDTATGAVRARLPDYAPREGRVQKLGGAAFSPDGSRLALVLSTVDDGARTTRKLVLWDAGARSFAGEWGLPDEVKIAPYIALPGVSWWGERHILLCGVSRDFGYLLEVGTGRLLAYAEAKNRSGRLLAHGPDARLWYVAGQASGAPGFLTAVDFPATDGTAPPRGAPLERWSFTPEGVVALNRRMATRP